MLTLFCNPPVILGFLLLVILLIVLLPLARQYIEGRKMDHEFDSSVWLLISLSAIAAISLVLFLIYTFGYVGGLGSFGC